MDAYSVGDKEAVIDYYSQGVAQFEKGINVSLSPSGEISQLCINTFKI